MCGIVHSESFALNCVYAVSYDLQVERRVLTTATREYRPVTIDALIMNEIKYKNIVGEKVRALRKSAGLSQEVLAERCSIFRTYLSRIESGSANPSLAVLVTLAKALEVEPHVLLTTPAAPHTPS